MFNQRHANGEFLGRRHRGKHAPDERSSSSSSSSCECEAGHDERECCRQGSGPYCCDREHHKFWKHAPPFFHFPRGRGHHGPRCSREERWAGPMPCPFLSSKDMNELPVTVHHGSMPIVTRGMVMFHIVSETKPSITISNTGAITVEADGIKLLSASLKENYPADKVVASYANKIVVIRIPCNVVTSEAPVDVPITIQK